MIKNIWQKIKPLLTVVIIVVFVAQLVLDAGSALAARSGGRIGGGSFARPAPSRSYGAPRGNSSYGYGQRGYGGGIGFPFLIPFFGFGGGFGGLFTIILLGVVANFLFNAFRQFRDNAQGDNEFSPNPSVSLQTVQVGLVSEARSLQTDLNRIALSANTQTPEGLTKVLQETTLALLRHPDYWVYGRTAKQDTQLQGAETQFNQLALMERGKLSAETLSNYRQEVQESAIAVVESGTDAVGEYIVVTLLVATLGKLNLPTVNNSADLRLALQTLGGVSSDRLLAVEVLWQPQAEGDTLSSDDVLLAYPELKLI